METNKLGQEPAFPRTAKISENSGKSEYSNKPQEGMSKRFYAANKSLATANNIIKEWSIKSTSDFIGINSDEYKYKLHYHVAVVKMSYILADELLRQENL